MLDVLEAGLKRTQDHRTAALYELWECMQESQVLGGGTKNKEPDNRVFTYEI